MSDTNTRLAVWLSGNALASINVVALRQTRLVLGWVTVCGRVTISVCNHPTRPTQTFILTGSMNRVPTCPVGHLCRVADNTVWSYWQVTSRSSEVNFTKNYTLLYTRWRKSDVISEMLVHCIFIFWVNTQNLTGWKRWELVEKLTPFDEILK